MADIADFKFKRTLPAIKMVFDVRREMRPVAQFSIARQAHPTA